MISVKKFIEMWRNDVSDRKRLEEDNIPVADYEKDVVEYEDMSPYQQMISDIAADTSRGELIPAEIIRDPLKLKEYIDDGVKKSRDKKKELKND